jgi:hypothetical protein
MCVDCQHADVAPDVDQPNQAGLTIRDIMQLQNSTTRPAGRPAEGEATMTPGAAASMPAPAARSPSDLEVEDDDEDEDAAWRARLAEELSGDEGGWAG